jgi:hypothetical protein
MLRMLTRPEWTMIGLPAVLTPERDKCYRRNSLLAERPTFPFSPTLQRLPLLSADRYDQTSTGG